MNESAALRLEQLRQVLQYVRDGRTALARGNLPRAVRFLRYAADRLSFTRALHCRWADVCATARLSRLVEDLEWRVEEALRPVPADPMVMVEDVADGLRILRTRDGFDLEEPAVYERARNVVAALIGKYEFRELRPIARESVHIESTGQ